MKAEAERPQKETVEPVKGDVVKLHAGMLVLCPGGSPVHRVHRVYLQREGDFWRCPVCGKRERV